MRRPDYMTIPEDDASVEDLSRAMVATVPAPLLVISSDYEVVTANRAFYTTFDTDPSQTEGRTLWTLGDGHWDFPDLRRRLAEVRAAGHTVEDFEVEHDFPRIGVRIMRLNARRLVRADDGRPLILIAMEDVTRRVQTDRQRDRRERQLEDAQEVARLGFWEQNLPSGEMWWSDRAYQMLGIDPDEGPATPEVLLTNAADEDRPFVEALVRKPDASFWPDSFTYRVHRQDGGRRWLEVRVKPVTREGRQVAVTGTVQDVTDGVHAEKARSLARYRDYKLHKLQQLEDAKALFLNAASHELNNPISPLKVQSHLLLAEKLGPLSEKQRGALQTMQRNVVRLEALAGDILDSARLQAGRLRIKPVEIDLSQVVRESVDSHTSVAGQYGLSITADVDDSLLVSADALRVGQVMANLLTNAIKYTEQEGTIHVTLSRDADQAFVRVQDTGIGMTSAQIGKLFQPFSQVHDSPLRSLGGRRGTGLGLYICKGIIEEHGGHIWAESEGPGTGTTMTFTLPLDRPDGQTRADPV